MIISRRNVLVLLSLVFLTFTGCGDSQLDGQNVVDLNTFGAGGCTLDANALGKMLEEDATAQINCLEDKLDQFLTLVDQDDESLIEKAKIKEFIDTFFQKDATVINNAIELGYELNHLLLRGDKDSLSVKNMRLLVKTLHVINIEGSALFNFMKNVTAETYWQSRHKLEEAGLNLAEALNKIINQRQGNTTINLEDLMDNLAEMTAGTDRAVDADSLKSYLFIKKLFFGGEGEFLSTNEVVSALRKVKDLLLLVYDFSFIGSKEDLGEFEKNLAYINLLDRTSDMTQSFDGSEYIVSLKKLLTFAGQLLPVKEGEAKKDLGRGAKAVEAIKLQLLGGPSDAFHYQDVLSLINLGKGIFEHFYFNEVVFDHYRNELSSPDEVRDLEFPDIDAIKRFSSERQQELWERFTFITENFRFFASDRFLQIYSRDFIRTDRGYNQGYVFHWILGQLFEIFGRDVEGKTRKVATKEDIENAVAHLKPLLEEIGFYPKDPKRFAFETNSSSDLFQYYANGDGYIDLLEIAQYINATLGGNTIGSDIADRLGDYCEAGVDQKGNPTYGVACFREHYHRVFLDDLDYKTNFPELYDYIQTLSEEDRRTFARNMESYGREIDDENLPITKVDLVRLSTSTSNLEATLMRYDVNRDHVFSIEELDNAYERFEKTIVDFGKLTEETKFMGRSIFLFLVKFQKQPHPAELVLFHFFGNKNKVQATRKEISGILALISKAAAADRQKP